MSIEHSVRLLESSIEVLSGGPLRTRIFKAIQKIIFPDILPRKMFSIIDYPCNNHLRRTGRSPFGALDTFFNEEPFFQLAPFAHTSPVARKLDMRLDIQETDTSYDIVADLPGVSKDNVNISVDGSVLTVSAERSSSHSSTSRATSGEPTSSEEGSISKDKEDKKQGMEGEDGTTTPKEDENRGPSFLFYERSFGKTSRSIKLPRHADLESITARCHDGELHITVPKLAEQQPRRVTVE